MSLVLLECLVLWVLLALLVQRALPVLGVLSDHLVLLENRGLLVLLVLKAALVIQVRRAR